jgi:predicted TIM-barrel enzyme
MAVSEREKVCANRGLVGRRNAHVGDRTHTETWQSMLCSIIYEVFRTKVVFGGAGIIAFCYVSDVLKLFVEFPASQCHFLPSDTHSDGKIRKNVAVNNLTPLLGENQFFFTDQILAYQSK